MGNSPFAPRVLDLILYLRNVFRTYFIKKQETSLMESDAFHIFGLKSIYLQEETGTLWGMEAAEAVSGNHIGVICLQRWLVHYKFIITLTAMRQAEPP